MKAKNWSLTTQLGALFACISAIVFSALGIYLYQALTVQLQARDDADLVDRIVFIRHMLEETPSVESIRVDPHRFLDAVDLHGGFLLVMQAQDGEELTRNTRDRSFMHASRAVPVETLPEPSHVRAAPGHSEPNLRVIAALGTVGSTGSVVKITLARSEESRAAVLSAYKLKVLASGFFGAVLTALLGFLLVRRALHKVKLIAQQAQQVSAHNLEVRLHAKSAPKEIQILADSFNEVLDRLQNSFNNLSQFADDLAHDLRTPLNNLMVQTEVALSQPRSSDEYQNLLSSNYEEFGRLARMVESILFLARADHDQVSLATEQLDMDVELTRIAEYFEGPASDAGISFIVIASGKVLADGHLLRRAVSNLVSNALRYTPKGEIILLKAIEDDDGAVVSVSNPGPGIAQEHLSRLFDRFYRSDKSRASTSASAGLGLSIVKSIMALHHGRASVTSELDGVTQFTLFFPGTTASNETVKR